MASPPILNFETLLAPVGGANPAGEPLPFDVRKKLDDGRKEINLNQFAPNDPRRPEQPQQADWPGVTQVAQDTLAQVSKDLLVAGRLTEALVKLHQFGGLRDGLRLMRRLIDECWDRIYPSIADGDLETRSAVFNWLDDELKGARFPNTLRMVALTRVGKDESDFTAQYGWQHWKDAQEAKGTVTAEMFEQAVIATPREYCQNIVDDLAACIDELMGLMKALTARMGDLAPGLAQIRRAVIDCQDLAKFVLQRKGPAPLPAEAPAPADEAANAAPSGAAPTARRALTREDVLNRLADASAILLQMEPHSPIAYMIQRAVKLARLPFPDLMKVLVRDASVLGQLDRDLDLGLETQDGARPGKR